MLASNVDSELGIMSSDKFTEETPNTYELKLANLHLAANHPGISQNTL